MARKEEGSTQGFLSRVLKLKKSFRFRLGHTLAVKPKVRGTWLHWAWNRPKAMANLGEPLLFLSFLGDCRDSPLATGGC